MINGILGAVFCGIWPWFYDIWLKYRGDFVRTDRNFYLVRLALMVGVGFNIWWLYAVIGFFNFPHQLALGVLMMFNSWKLMWLLKRNPWPNVLQVLNVLQLLLVLSWGLVEFYWVQDVDLPSRGWRLVVGAYVLHFVGVWGLQVVRWKHHRVANYGLAVVVAGVQVLQGWWVFN